MPKSNDFLTHDMLQYMYDVFITIGAGKNNHTKFHVNYAKLIIIDKQITIWIHLIEDYPRGWRHYRKMYAKLFNF